MPGVQPTRDRPLTEAYSEPSVVICPFAETETFPHGHPRHYTWNEHPPISFAEIMGTENSRLNKLSQMVTYYVCD